MKDEAHKDLAWRTDLMRLSLAGNLRDYTLQAVDGRWRRGDEIGYGETPAAYGTQPVDSIAYVSSHDDETLFDRLAYKLPLSTPMADRVRMNTLCLATITLGQTPAFWAAGSELLRSKSLDGDSHNSGDHFNALDWAGRDNGWGRGFPRRTATSSRGSSRPSCSRTTSCAPPPTTSRSLRRRRSTCCACGAARRSSRWAPPSSSTSA